MAANVLQAVPGIVMSAGGMGLREQENQQPLRLAVCATPYTPANTSDKGLHNHPRPEGAGRAQ